MCSFLKSATKLKLSQRNSLNADTAIKIVFGNATSHNFIDIDFFSFFSFRQLFYLGMFVELYCHDLSQY